MNRKKPDLLPDVLVRVAEHIEQASKVLGKELKHVNLQGQRATNTKDQ